VNKSALVVAAIRGANADLLILQVAQFASSSADGSWHLDIEITSQTFARQLMQYA
tara:strand:- start:254 stop:418 length:165 start_codon:yes stop_codon:yes gene_type:complete